VARIIALIPAAGKSRRMGQCKLSLPLGGRTVLEAVTTAVREASVETILVVVGPDAAHLQRLAEKCGASVLTLVRDTAHMRDTIVSGIDWLEMTFKPTPGDGFLLVPADHPCLEQDVIRKILQARAEHVENSIVVPTWDSRRGHPVWIAWEHVEGIRAQPAAEGLNSYLRRHAADTLNVAVNTESILWDMDTPEDFERIKAWVHQASRVRPFISQQHQSNS
jgi:molybdenum cofactor cytidylyltransferase